MYLKRWRCCAGVFCMFRGLPQIFFFLWHNGHAIIKVTLCELAWKDCDERNAISLAVKEE